MAQRYSRENVEQIADLAMYFFDSDSERAIQWLDAANAELNGYSPIEVIACGQDGRLLEWIFQQLMQEKSIDFPVS